MDRLRAVAGACRALGALAQEPEPARPPRAEPPPREEAWKLVDAYILSNLQESLGLSDEQFVKLLPLVKTLQASRRGFMQRRGELIGRCGGCSVPERPQRPGSKAS